MLFNSVNGNGTRRLQFCALQEFAISRVRNIGPSKNAFQMMSTPLSRAASSMKVRLSLSCRQEIEGADATTKADRQRPRKRRNLSFRMHKSH